MKNRDIIKQAGLGASISNLLAVATKLTGSGLTEVGGFLRATRKSSSAIPS